MTPLAATLAKQAPADPQVTEVASAPPPPPLPPPTAPPASTPVLKATAKAAPKAPPVAAQRIDRRVALWLGIGCPLITAINIVIEPLPADPNAPVPLAASLLFLVFTAAVVGTSVFAARREVRTLPVATLAGALAVVLTVSCPTSGHHTSIGWWWYTQMVLSGGFVAFAATAWRRHRSPAS